MPDEQMVLLFSEECPYCRTIAKTINLLDIPGKIETVPIESERGTDMVIDHHGDYIHSPHLFTDSLVYYGVSNVAWGLAKEYFSE